VALSDFSGKQKMIIIGNSQENWENDSIQFARLIDELEAVGGFTNEIVEDLCASMDLERDELFEIVERAQKVWDDIKARI